MAGERRVTQEVVEALDATSKRLRTTQGIVESGSQTRKLARITTEIIEVLRPVGEVALEVPLTFLASVRRGGDSITGPELGDTRSYLGFTRSGGGVITGTELEDARTYIGVDRTGSKPLL